MQATVCLLAWPVRKQNSWSQHWEGESKLSRSGRRQCTGTNNRKKQNSACSAFSIFFFFFTVSAQFLFSSSCPVSKFKLVVSCCVSCDASVVTSKMKESEFDGTARGMLCVTVPSWWWKEEAKRQAREKCVCVCACLEGFESVAQGFFHLSTTAPRRLWSSYLCLMLRVVGDEQVFSTCCKVCAQPVLRRREREGGSGERSKHRSCTQNCDQCRQDCDTLWTRREA